NPVPRMAAPTSPVRSWAASSAPLPRRSSPAAIPTRRAAATSPSLPAPPAVQWPATRSRTASKPTAAATRCTCGWTTAAPPRSSRPTSTASARDPTCGSRTAAPGCTDLSWHRSASHRACRTAGPLARRRPPLAGGLFMPAARLPAGSDARARRGWRAFAAGARRPPPQRWPGGHSRRMPAAAALTAGEACGRSRPRGAADTMPPGTARAVAEPSMDAQSIWYAIAIVLVLVGLAGIVLPALPGLPLVFVGMLVAAWAGGFEQVGGWTLLVLAVLTLVSIGVDFLASAAGARRVGASRLAVGGAL